MPKAVVLLSGGLDSAVTLACSVYDGNETIALSFRYGQRHTKELVSAKAVAEHYNMRHVVTDIDMSMFRSSLIGNSKEIEKDRTNIGKDIPDTYVPARNMIMLSIATGLCESVDADRIYIGANSVDYSGYPDCRNEFFKVFEEMIKKGTKAGVEGRPIKIVTPILDLSKSEIVKLGKKLNVPLHLTWSCYSGGDKACGRCDSCILRLNGFKDAGYKDEVEYQ
ncbi:MAG: 7-cyano-7-deazaguanine synthase QueC [Methanomassiliicoccaceae archaeon]|jgi:7-cyano-7-deazaguanine synthase|nr:7-cyano-7-deazaguanine synthase QueC [Methanomassiliicoccaceae archaeon]